MTPTADLVPIINRALQVLGTRTTVSAAELDEQSSNEAIQALVVIDDVRRDLLRMAPWGSAQGIANLDLICAAPGAANNASALVGGVSGDYNSDWSGDYGGGEPVSQTPSSLGNQWTPGTPPPPWLYEYAFPGDCIRALSIIPPGYGVPDFLDSIRFGVRSEFLYKPTLTGIVSAGQGFSVGDQVKLIPANAPAGAPIVVQIDGLSPGFNAGFNPGFSQGGVASLEIIGGGYLTGPAMLAIQSDTSGLGTGLTADFTYARGPVRVIVTNAPLATLLYVRNVEDPAALDPGFISAWVDILASKLAMALTGDKTLANLLIKQANQTIAEARAEDANEEVVVMDIQPDFILARGAALLGPFGTNNYDWGPLWPTV